MRHFAGTLGLLSLVCTSLPAQDHKAVSEAKSGMVHTASFLDVEKLSLAEIVPAPPPQGSDIAKSEFAELHRIQDARTPEQVKAAQADDPEEDIFVCGWRTRRQIPRPLA